MSDAAMLPPFAPGIFTGMGETTRLIGSRCPGCDAVDFPARAECGDGGEPVPVELPPRGTLYSYTVVHTKPPFGLPAPYALGYVDLADGGPRVLMPLDPASIGRLAIGMALRLASGSLGVDLAGQPCIRPFFTPEAG